jgi:hypothetical protein
MRSAPNGLPIKAKLRQSNSEAKRVAREMGRIEGNARSEARRLRSRLRARTLLKQRKRSNDGFFLVEAAIGRLLTLATWTDDLSSNTCA